MKEAVFFILQTHMTNFDFAAEHPSYSCSTNHKTFTLILTWLSNNTSGNGMAKRQHYGKYVIG